MVGLIDRIRVMRDTLEKKLFFDMTAIVLIITIVSAIATFFEEVGWIYVFVNLFCVFIMVATIVVANKFGHRNACYFVIILTLNMLCIPINFFACGGVRSGMVIYLLAGLALTAFVGKNSQKIISFVFSLIVFMGLIVLQYFCEYDIVVNKPVMEGTGPVIWGNHLFAYMAPDVQFMDFAMTIVLSGTGLFVLCMIVVGAFEKERSKSQDLNFRLEYLSNRDSITGLHSRRAVNELLRKLENGKKYYMFMCEVDDNEKFATKYGEDTVNNVISRLGQLITDSVNEKDCEFAARVSDTKFMTVYNEEDIEKAVDRADRIRNLFDESIWDIRSLHPTISGSVISFVAYEGKNVGIEISNQAIALLKLAQRDGFNTIKMQ